MTRITLIPARARDYKSALAVRIDLASQRDFIVADASSKWDGKPCNLADLRRAGITEVNVRYMAQRRVTVIDITGNLE